MGKREILVIHGGRQTGKTTLLKMIMEYLVDERKVPKENIFYFDLEEFDLLELCNKGHTKAINYLERHWPAARQKVEVDFVAEFLSSKVPIE